MSEKVAQQSHHEWFSTFAAFGLEGEDVDGFLDAIMGELAGDLSGGKRGLTWAISVLQGDHVETWAASSPETFDLDGLQHSFEDAPALAAVLDGEFVHIADIRQERRWPGYASVVVGHGVLSLISVPLDPEGSLSASINVYAPLAHSFTSDDILTVQNHAREMARSFHLAIQVSGKQPAARDSRTLVGVASPAPAPPVPALPLPTPNVVAELPP